MIGYIFAQNVPLESGIEQVSVVLAGCSGWFQINFWPLSHAFSKPLIFREIIPCGLPTETFGVIGCIFAKKGALGGGLNRVEPSPSSESTCPEYTLLAKKVVTPPLKTIKPMWIELLCFHLASYGPVIVPQRNPTLPWRDIQCKVKWDRRAPKPQYRWSFLQINLHTATTLNQYLHIFSKVFWLFKQCPIQPQWVLGMRCLHLPVRA